MKKTTLFSGAIAGLLLMAVSGFSAIPDSVWKNDTLFHDMWNKKTLDTSTFWPHTNNWSVTYPGTDSAMIATDGLAHTGDPGWTNLVWKWQASPAQKNVELRFQYRMAASPSGNSGFNMRGYCGSGTIATLCGGASQGYRVFGPQIDLGPTYTGNLYYSGSSTYATAVAACHLNTTNFMDLSYLIRNDTVQMSYYPNGFSGTRTLCSTYKLTAANDVAATSPGLIALQYETVKVDQFRRIQIRNLDGVGGGTAIKNIHSGNISNVVNGGKAGLSFSILESGTYSVKITELNGKTVRNIQGMGPVSNQNVSLGHSGIFIVKMTSPHHTSLKRVYVH